MGAYERAIASAKRLITQKGRAIVIVTFADSAPLDPSVPWRTGSPFETEQNTVGVFVATSQEKSQGGNATPASGQAVHREICDILIPAAGLTLNPNLKGEIRAGNDRWSVVRVVPLAPSGVPIIYTVTVAR